MSAEPDPALYIKFLFKWWDATVARLDAAGIVQPRDHLTQEVWASGGIVTLERDGARIGAFGVNIEGKLIRYDVDCDCWEIVEEEAARD